MLQRRFPSIAARVLFANSLLSSCLWFYAYFIPPSEEQLQRFDSKVPGVEKVIGKVNRGRMAAPKEQGGFNVVVSSTMFPAIQSNVVNRALLAKGK